MPKVRALVDLTAGNPVRRIRKGEVFEVTDAQLAYTRKRYLDRGKTVRPPYELVAKPAAKPAEEAKSDVSDIA